MIVSVSRAHICVYVCTRVCIKFQTSQQRNTNLLNTQARWHIFISTAYNQHTEENKNNVYRTMRDTVEAQNFFPFWFNRLNPPDDAQTLHTPWQLAGTQESSKEMLHCKLH